MSFNLTKNTHNVNGFFQFPSWHSTARPRCRCWSAFLSLCHTTSVTGACAALPLTKARWLWNGQLCFNWIQSITISKNVSITWLIMSQFCSTFLVSALASLLSFSVLRSEKGSVVWSVLFHPGEIAHFWVLSWKCDRWVISPIHWMRDPTAVPGTLNERFLFRRTNRDVFPFVYCRDTISFFENLLACWCWARQIVNERSVLSLDRCCLTWAANWQVTVIV